MARRKSSQLQPLSLSISKLLKPERMRRLSSIGILNNHWPDIVGAIMAQHSEPIAIEPQQDGSLGLIIAVNHPVIAQQVRFLHEDIRKACFKRCQLQGLTKVWTRVQPGAGIRKQKKEQHINQIHYKDLRRLAESLQDVEDKALRRLMFHAGTAQLRFKKK